MENSQQNIRVYADIFYSVVASTVAWPLLPATVLHPSPSVPTRPVYLAAADTDLLGGRRRFES